MVKILNYSPNELMGKHFSKIIFSPEIENISRAIVLSKYSGRVTGDGDSPKLFDERRTGARSTTGLNVRLVQKRESDNMINTLESETDELIMVEVNSSGMFETSLISDQKEFLGSAGVIRDISKRTPEKPEIK